VSVTSLVFFLLSFGGSFSWAFHPFLGTEPLQTLANCTQSSVTDESTLLARLCLNSQVLLAGLLEAHHGAGHTTAGHPCRGGSRSETKIFLKIFPFFR
jgi:hypothetical protein